MSIETFERFGTVNRALHILVDVAAFVVVVVVRVVALIRLVQTGLEAPQEELLVTGSGHREALAKGTCSWLPLRLSVLIDLSVNAQSINMMVIFSPFCPISLIVSQWPWKIEHCSRPEEVGRRNKLLSYNTDPGSSWHSVGFVQDKAKRSTRPLPQDDTSNVCPYVYMDAQDLSHEEVPFEFCLC